MRRRRSHPLDMLPLLDVFMVVLFVFASIQEDQLQSTHERVKRAEAELQVADSVREHTRKTLTERAEQANATARQAQTQAEQAQADALRLRAALQQLRQEARAASKHSADASDDALRRREMLTKLLDQISVFEIEIAGAIADDGTISNRCCFRAELGGSGWQTCGTVPARADDQDEWLDTGADGLMAALRRTKGGTAVTIVRQDETATYRIASAITAQMRERLDDHQLYDEGLALTELCADVTEQAPGGAAQMRDH